MASIARSIFVIAYGTLGIILAPLVALCILYDRYTRKKPLGRFSERIGLIPNAPTDKKVIWLHAVSVGEVLSLQALIAELKAADPRHYIYLTVGTVSGRKMAEQFCNADQLAYLPFDFIIPMLLAWHRIHPATVMVAESELWPLLIMLPHVFDVPVYSISRRKASKAASWLSRFPSIFRFLLNTFSRIYVQHQSDADFFTALGVTAEKINVMGDLKSWNVLQKQQLHTNPVVIKSQKNPIIMAGSIHPGEADTILSAYQKVIATHPSARLLCVPRHFQWMQDLVATCTTRGLTHQLLTQNSLAIINQLYTTEALPHVTIVAELGVMFDLYRYADLFILGGTFVTIGGHNLLEPATWGVSSAVGPHHENVVNIVAQHQTTHAITVTQNAAELAQWCTNELEHSTQRTLHGATLHNWLIEESKPVKQTVTELITRLHAGNL